MPLPSIRRGERHPAHKLTKAQVLKARALAEAEDLPVRVIRERLGVKVSLETLRKAIRGETWADENGG